MSVESTLFFFLAFGSLDFFGFAVAVGGVAVLSSSFLAFGVTFGVTFGVAFGVALGVVAVVDVFFSFPMFLGKIIFLIYNGIGFF